MSVNSRYAHTYLWQRKPQPRVQRPDARAQLADWIMFFHVWVWLPHKTTAAPVWRYCVATHTS